jgi:hypothetical protein
MLGDHQEPEEPMRRLSRNQIEEEIEMFEHVDQQRAERDRQEKIAADKSHSWVNFTRGAAFTDEQLQKLRDACKAVGGRPLTDEERQVVLYGKVQPRIQSGIPIL